MIGKIFCYVTKPPRLYYIEKYIYFLNKQPFLTKLNKQNKTHLRYTAIHFLFFYQATLKFIFYILFEETTEQINKHTAWILFPLKQRRYKRPPFFQRQIQLFFNNKKQRPPEEEESLIFNGRKAGNSELVQAPSRASRLFEIA